MVCGRVQIMREGFFVIRKGVLSTCA